MARRRGLLRLRAILFSRRLDGEDLPHEVGEFAGKSGVVQRGDAGEIIRLAAVVGTDRFAVVMAEKQRLAAADFAAVQDENAAVFIARKDAGKGAVQSFCREIDLCGKRHFFARDRRTNAKTIPAFFVLYLLRVP